MTRSARPFTQDDLELAIVTGVDQCLLSVGPAGVEPTPCGLKVRRAASYTTTLKAEAYAFVAKRHGLLLLISVTISGSPEN